MNPDRTAGSAGAARSGPRESRRGRRWPLALALLATVAASLALVVTPVWIMRPFQPQTAAGMATAHALLRLAPLLSALAILIVAALAWRLFRVTRWAGRAALAVALLVVLAVAWVAHQNVIAWAFPPIHRPGYVPGAAAASFVAPGDPVLALQIRGESVAYPVRQLAYHHVVEDVVGGTPLVVTY